MIDKLTKLGIELPEEVKDLLQSAKKLTWFNTTEELRAASTNGIDNKEFEVKYNIPGKGEVTEAIVHQVTNGVSSNYIEPYMRRRDPNTMFIADELPTDKPLFKDEFGYDFKKLEGETYDWFKGEELCAFLYFAGYYPIGAGGLVIAPANAAFFAYGLGLLQKTISLDAIPEGFAVESIIYVAPTFRHTHFNGKQVVVHKRGEKVHEMYSYNLYPGPSAKKGLYGALLHKGEKEGWITTHCSTVRAISPYDNATTFMHEGASGGGKSEMMQHLLTEEDGQVLIARNLQTDERRHITIPTFCTFQPVTDDMGMCHYSYQNGNGKLRIMDAENSWFIRVDSIKQYGDDPALEKLTIEPSTPLAFLSIDTKPGCTALIWDHIEDAPGKTCPNPRVVVPRNIIPNILNEPVSVDIRSFGVRTPPSTKEDPTYGILGVFHVLPPALAWLWRLVSPRGYGNPSIVSNGVGMESEGVGSYWPFATGKMVDQANLLLEQIINTPEVKYTLTPNQHIGVWKVDFKPQLLMREYLTRRGNANLRPDQYQPARCPLLGYELNYLTIESNKIPTRFLKPYKQPELGEEGYDAGAKILTDFFKKEITQYLQADLHPLGKKIIEACLNDCTLETYNELLPGK